MHIISCYSIEKTKNSTKNVFPTKVIFSIFFQETYHFEPKMFFQRTSASRSLHLLWLLLLTLLYLLSGARVLCMPNEQDSISATVTTTTTITIEPDENVPLNPELERLIINLINYEKDRKVKIVKFITHQLYDSTDLQRNRSMRFTFAPELSNSSTATHRDPRNSTRASRINHNSHHNSVSINNKDPRTQWRNLINLFNKINTTHVVLHFLASKNRSGRYVSL